MASVALSVVKPFDGTGSFSNWLIRVKTCLDRHGVLETLDEVDKTKDTDKIKDKQASNERKMDAQARDIIIQSVADNVLEIIKEEKTAREMINVLTSTYEKSGLASRVDLQKKFRNLVLPENASLQKFLMEFEKTLTELRQVGGKMDEDEVIIQLLSSMPVSFKPVVTSIDILFSKDPSSVDLKFVKSKLLSEEKRLQDSGEVQVGESFSASTSNKKDFKNRKFDFSKQNKRQESDSNLMFSGKCYECQGRGHKRNQCPNLKRVNNSYRFSNCEKKDNRNSTRDNRFSKQCQANVSDIDSGINDITFLSDICLPTRDVCDTSLLEIDFIIDSGASCHLLESKWEKYLVDAVETSRMINVAKVGEAITAKASGKLHVMTNQGMNVTIKSVLLCDNLSRNLLSVRCMEESGLTVIFNRGCVEILKDGHMLFTGQRKGNLYETKFY